MTYPSTDIDKISVELNKLARESMRSRQIVSQRTRIFARLS
jgi:hypothetical protein